MNDFVVTFFQEHIQFFGIRQEDIDESLLLSLKSLGNEEIYACPRPKPRMLKKLSLQIMERPGMRPKHELIPISS
jgi:hypothetical protein